MTRRLLSRSQYQKPCVPVGGATRPGGISTTTEKPSRGASIRVVETSSVLSPRMRPSKSSPRAP